MLKLGCALTFVLLSFVSSMAQNPPASSIAKVGNGVSAPKLLHHPDPEYSEKARQARYEGICILWVVVGTDGIPRDVRVARSIGMGLDEKAVEAIRKWTFEPALKDGQPVPVQINVEVSFKLHHGHRNDDPRFDRLQTDANAGDAKAEFELAQKFFEGQDVPKDTISGTQLLLKSANQNYPEAQFLLGDLYSSGSQNGDLIEAYMWYSLAGRNGKKTKDQLKKLESRMTADQLADARSRIEKWQPTPAK